MLIVPFFPCAITHFFYSFMKYINDNEDYSFQDFVPAMQEEAHKNFRLGSFYVRELYVMIHDYELACKLHTVRMVAQFMRDMVRFFSKLFPRAQS